MPHPRPSFQIEDTSSSAPEEVVQPHASVAESGLCVAGTTSASKVLVEGGLLEENPLDIAIKEIVTTIEVPVIETVMSLQEESLADDHITAVAKEDGVGEMDFKTQMNLFADQLNILREKYNAMASSRSAASNSTMPNKLYVCFKCGREYKYKSFLQVHQKRKCW